MAVVGVLALQGSYNEHMAGTESDFMSLCCPPDARVVDFAGVCFGAALRRIGVKGVEVRKPEQLLGVDSLIIPGGESTTMAKLANYHNLVGGSSSFCSPRSFFFPSCLWLMLIGSSMTSLVTLSVCSDSVAGAGDESSLCGIWWMMEIE